MVALVWRLTQFVFGLGLGFYLARLLEDQEAESWVQLAPPILQGSNEEATLLPLLPLVVGVMTASQFLDTRACSVWRTWALEVEELGGKVHFFVGSGVKGGSWCSLPLVSLSGVSDSDYPPQEKSFTMLHWLHSTYNNR